MSYDFQLGFLPEVSRTRGLPPIHEASHPTTDLIPTLARVLSEHTAWLHCVLRSFRCLSLNVTMGTRHTHSVNSK